MIDIEQNKLTAGSPFGNLQCLCGQVIAPLYKVFEVTHYSDFLYPENAIKPSEYN
tara:strand:- start:19593 stop:19757 length:165 start_codon:yes stop_codon:yes gene_type:complete